MPGYKTSDIQNLMEHHAPDEETAAYHEKTRELMIEVTENIFDYLPESVERSNFLTSMREALMWANAAIAINDVP